MAVHTQEVRLRFCGCRETYFEGKEHTVSHMKTFSHTPRARSVKRRVFPKMKPEMNILFIRTPSFREIETRQ